MDKLNGNDIKINANTDAANTDATNTDAANTDATNTDAANTDAANTDATNTDAANTDATNTDAANTDATNTDAANTDAANDLDLYLLHPDIQHDLEMRNMYYNKYINSSDFYIKTKYVNQFFESKYENYISICSFINFFNEDELSLYNVCNFHRINYNYLNQKYYFRIIPENINIFITDNWPDMKVFLMNFIDEYIDKINIEKEEKEKKLFEEIRKYILIKGISREDFANMIKL